MDETFYFKRRAFGGLRTVVNAHKDTDIIDESEMSLCLKLKEILVDLVDICPNKKHEMKAAGLLINHLCMTAVTIDCPAGPVSRITKSHKLRFPELIMEFSNRIVNLVYNINHVVTESLRLVQEDNGSLSLDPNEKDDKLEVQRIPKCFIVRGKKRKEFEE